MKSKAILEFDYPDDETQLLFALKGVDMYATLAAAAESSEEEEEEVRVLDFGRSGVGLD